MEYFCDVLYACVSIKFTVNPRKFEIRFFEIVAFSIMGNSGIHNTFPKSNLQFIWIHFVNVLKKMCIVHL